MVATGASGGIAHAKDVTIGIVYVGPRDDFGWNQAHAVAVKALSEGYFKLLDKHPELKEVFRMGHHLVWVTPSGTALVLDTLDGKETLTDDEIASLFTKK